MGVSKEVYLQKVLNQTPRLLGLMDRNILSKAYGCFDRNYWHYSTSDFANARKQEAVLTLALLYKTRQRDNLYFGKESVLELVNAALGFWAKIQYRNGSFSEWYPNEYSFVATSFSGYAVSETLLEIKNGVEGRGKIVEGLERAADFVARHVEKRASNQEVGSIVFLYNVFLLTGKKKFESAARQKLALFLKSQSKEGWFREYGGFDSGYHSLAIDYLAKYYAKSGDGHVLSALSKAVEFLCFFAHPDGSVGGPYCSRNTEYIIPSGLEQLSQVIPKASLLASYVRRSLDKMVSISSLDDHYLCYNGYTYLQAFLAASGKLKVAGRLPFEKTFQKLFPESGLFVKSLQKRYYLVASAFKGGAFKLFSQGESMEDYGMLVETTAGKSLFSSAFNRANAMRLDGNCFRVSGLLAIVPKRLFSPAKNILLRVYQLSLGKSGKVSRITREALRSMLITKKSLSKVSFTREICFDENSVSVSDSLKPAKKLKSVFLGFNASHIFVPSSNYFSQQKIDASVLKLSRKGIGERTKDGVFCLTRP